MWKLIAPIAALGLAWTAQAATSAQQVLSESMAWMDDYYDPTVGYLHDLGGGAALRHNTRSSGWYALGLLARNKGTDAAEADKIILNIIEGQFKDPSKQWYGTYQKFPEEPAVGSENYPARMYNSWDPNWRGFVGTTLVIILEEYPHLLPNSTHQAIVDSLFHAAVGDTYRVGGVDGDNLWPAYSNPSIMRAFLSGWMGHRINDENMTVSGEAYATEIIELFNLTNTLSEFNSGTYTGVSLFGLTLWSKYLPQDSVMSQQGPRMLRETWGAVSQLWHSTMRNMAGPWDRSYGYDMNRYVSVTAIWLWAFIGKEASSMYRKPQLMSHAPDYAWGPLVGVLADFQASLMPEGFFDKLKTFDGERTFKAQAYYPPLDNVPRNISTWLSEKITIGSESYDMNVMGGPATSQEAFNPAVVQWLTNDEISFLSLYPTEDALSAEVSPNKLTLKYPRGSASSIFSLVVSTFNDKRTVSSLEDIQGLKVAVSGNVNPAYKLTFAGANGGADKTLRTFEFWNFTYSMPEGFQGVPSLVLDFEIDRPKCK